MPDQSDTPIEQPEELVGQIEAPDTGVEAPVDTQALIEEFAPYTVVYRRALMGNWCSGDDGFHLRARQNPDGHPNAGVSRHLPWCGVGSHVHDVPVEAISRT